MAIGLTLINLVGKTCHPIRVALIQRGAVRLDDRHEDPLPGIQIYLHP
jgi:hypothetical protein